MEQSGSAGTVRPEDRHALERRILSALEKPLPPRGASPRYLLALGALAGASLLLPVLYGLCILAAGAGVAWWARFGSHFLFDRTHGRTHFSYVTLLLWAAPLVAGAFVVILLLKPLVARREEDPPLDPVDPGAEPFLYSFVDRLCALLGAPRPDRIRVDLSANASAALEAPKRFFGRRTLAITVGAVLLRSLSLRQLAGVLAHETGHLSQRFALACQAMVLGVNRWLVHVVEQRDAWDTFLDEESEAKGCSIALLFLFARGCVGLVRKLMKGLLVVSHALSMEMSRQMEWDSDRCEALVAGSAVFEETTRRLRLLDASYWVAHQILGDGELKRLPDDLPAFVAYLADKCPDRVRARIEEAADRHVVRWWESHPADRDRVEAARRLGAAGVGLAELPATSLLRDPARFCREASLAHYGRLLGPRLTPELIVPENEFERRREEKVEGQVRTWRWFHGCAHSRRPWPVADEFVELPSGHAAARDAMDAARSAVLQEAAGWRRAVQRWEEAEDRIYSGVRCHAILEAVSRRAVERFDARKFREARDVGLAEEKQLDAILAPLRPLEGAAARRIALVLSLSEEAWLLGEGAAAAGADARRLRAALNFLADSVGPLEVAVRVWTGLEAYGEVQARLGLGKPGVAVWREESVRLRAALQEVQPLIPRAADAFAAEDPGTGIVNLLPQAVLERAEGAQLEAMARELMKRRYNLFLWSLHETARLGEAVEDALGLPRMPDVPEEEKPWA